MVHAVLASAITVTVTLLSMVALFLDSAFSCGLSVFASFGRFKLFHSQNDLIRRLTNRVVSLAIHFPLPAFGGSMKQDVDNLVVT